MRQPAHPDLLVDITTHDDAGVVRGRKISDLIERAVSEDRERHAEHDDDEGR